MNYMKYWIALEQSSGIGPAHMLEIHEKIKALGLGIPDLFDLKENEISHEFGISAKLAQSICAGKESLDRIEADYIRTISRGMSIIPFFSGDYPRRLLEKLGHGFPPILYAFGNTALFRMKGVAMLGEKGSSDKGEMIAMAGAKILARHEIAVIGGMAQGIGTWAHRGVLEGGGCTIVFVPYGMDHLHLPDFLMNLPDTERILIVSSFYPTKEANKFNAFIRNRYICAASRAVYIVEAPEAGGILESAKSAMNLGIPLFTTEYGAWPPSALGNKSIIESYGGIPVKGKMEASILVPNMDRIIGAAKFE